jgi:hypothetical protein
MQNPDFNEKRRNAETNDLIYEGIATVAWGEPCNLC